MTVSAHPPVAAPPRPRPHLDALTGLRFFAAAYVVTYHYAAQALQGAPALARNINGGGPTAVSVFFVLSGLVLAYGATDDQGRCAKPPRRFWLDRFARIWPLFAVAAIAAMPLDLGRLRHEWATPGAAAYVYMVVHTVLALLLVQAWVPFLAVTANGPGWSLSVEAFFYVVFPRLVHRLRVRDTAALVRRIVVLWTLSVVPVLVVYAVERHWPALRVDTVGFLGVHITKGFALERLVINNPLFRLPEFCIGICLGHWLVAHGASSPTDVRTPADVGRPGSRLRPIELAGLAALGTILVVVSFSGAAHDPRELLIQSGYLSPAIAVLLVAVACGARPFARPLRHPSLAALGTASYALYIIQEPFEYYWSKLVGLDLARPVWFVAFAALLLATSFAAERIIEIPARRRIIGRWAPRLAAPVPAAPNHRR